MRTVPDELKIYELSKLWKEAEYDFAFWDKLHIDWDAEYKAALPRVLAAKDVYDYYKELRRFAALLCDRHTDVSNGYTFSAGEDFVDVMKAHTDAVFIDSNTADPSGQPLQVKLESGGWFRICTRCCFAQNGEDIYNKGFAPDIRVEHSLADQTEGRDRALEKVVTILKEKAGL